MTDPQPLTDEQRFTDYQVHWCGASLEEAARRTRERPDLVEAWNLIRREHEYRDRWGRDWHGSA